MRRIICIGNRYREGDEAGPRVYDYLAQRALPPGVEVHDGGLGGLNLLALVESSQRVVFVDSVRGFAAEGEVVLLQVADLPLETDAAYGHDSGLGYLLHVLPKVCEGPVPEISVVGLEGKADERVVALAAALALRQFSNEIKGISAATAPDGGRQ